MKIQVSAGGLLVCLLASFLSTDLFQVKEEKDIEWVRSYLIFFVQFFSSWYISNCECFVSFLFASVKLKINFQSAALVGWSVGRCPSSLKNGS